MTADVTSEKMRRLNGLKVGNVVKVGAVEKRENIPGWCNSIWLGRSRDNLL